MIGSQIRVPILAILIAALSTLAMPSGAHAGHVNAFLGTKVLDENDWSPMDQHTELGLEMSWGGPDWPVMIATDLFGSWKGDNVAGIDVEASTGELGLGVRKIWNTGGQKRVHPYIGGGIAFISANLEGTSGGAKVSDDDSGVGAWLGGGIFWRLGGSFNLGLALRGSSATVDLFGVEGDGGGGHFGLLAGWGWPKSR